ncbi:MAG: hypothetical protein ABS55_03805 [Lautropia sp. SCN 70-15]|nr:MAG: hypothetical protein ABS55_03805 [Lautropia sp. SCN 70-15]
MTWRNLAIVLPLVTLTGVAHARTAPLVEPERMLLPAAQGKARGVDNVRAAIISGGQSLGWSVLQDEPGKLTLKYNKQGKHEVVVDALYDEQSYQLRYVDSTNMNYNKDDSGANIHPNYNRWIRNLIKYIGSAAR